MSYLLVILLLAVLILVHETGHFLVARAVGIPVARFSVGFGPAVISVTRNGTEYRLAAFPFGGYVLPAFRDAAELYAVALWRRVAFYVGGPLANLLAAVPLLAARNWRTEGPTLRGALVDPWRQTAEALGNVLGAVVSLPTQLHKDVAFLPGIIVDGGEAVAAGAGLELAVVLSLSLGVMNLLPVPVLDGGQIALHVLEYLSPRTRRLHESLTVVCGLLLAALMLVGSLAEIVAMTSGTRAERVQDHAAERVHI